ncbi:MAG: hypothetical protein OMM_11897, partial [Candidatus Magnetoglobus multicellularis str. Araruama]
FIYTRKLKSPILFNNYKHGLMKTMFMISFAVIVLFMPILSGASDAIKPASEQPFLGVYLSPQTDLKEYGQKFSGQKGLYIPLVLYQSAAEDAGMLKGDVILKYDNRTFDDTSKSKLLKTFKNYIRDDKNIHDSLKLHILRKKQFYKGTVNKQDIPETPYHADDFTGTIEDLLPGETISVSIYKEVEELTITAILGRKPHMRDMAPPSNAQLFPHYENYTNPDIQAIDQMIHHHSLKDAYDDLIKRLSEDEWWDDGFRTSFFRYVHRDPKKFPIMADDLTNKLAQSVSEKISPVALNQIAANLMDVTGNFTNHSLLNIHAESCAVLLTQIIGYHRQLEKLYQQAFAQLTLSEKEMLKNEVPQIMERFVDHYYLDIDADVAEMKYHRQISALGRKIQYPYLYQASCLLQELSEPQVLSAFAQFGQISPLFQEPPENLGISGDVLCIRKINSQYIVIGGPGVTRYTKPVSWIIDLGGDDLYLNNAGAATFDNQISIVIDLQGNDQYTATENWAQGAGFMGFGLLVDRRGQDHYTANRLSQGCAVMGIGHLIDLQGDDQYHGQELHQGIAFWGFGTLIDQSGNDTYDGALFAQAVGGTYGLGILVDTDGNDTYYASGKHKSSYDTDGIFRGSSQGFGIGFRGIASGGIGILLDIKGKDQFMAGNFSQGGGYFFGLGILKNAGKESDTYLATRYGQGFSAHSAAGILIDDGGNDIY